MGFECLHCEWCIYRRNSPAGVIIFAVHVDNIIAAASSPEKNAHFANLLIPMGDHRARASEART